MDGARAGRAAEGQAELAEDPVEAFGAALAEPDEPDEPDPDVEDPDPKDPDPEDPDPEDPDPEDPDPEDPDPVDDEALVEEDEDDGSPAFFGRESLR